MTDIVGGQNKPTFDTTKQIWRRFRGLPLRRQVLLSLLLLLIIIQAIIGPRLQWHQTAPLYPPIEVATYLDDQVWDWLARAECPSAKWQPDFSSLAGYRGSVTPLREQLEARTGKMPQTEGGKVLEERLLFENERFTISWLRIISRLPEVSVSGYLARPRGIEGATPAVVVAHGAGVPAHTLFGWRLSGDKPHVAYPDNSPLGLVGVKLVESGYTVFAPWIADEDGDWLPFVANPKDTFLPWNWFEVSRWGALHWEKKRSDAHGVLVPQLMASLDFLTQDKQVDSGRIALMGWAEGAHLAGITAALDERIAATVLLEPPLDKRALLSDPVGMRTETLFTMLSCTFGHEEVAALVAPRSLLFSYSTTDPHYMRRLAYVSDNVYSQISNIYEELGVADRVSRVASDDQSGAVEDVPLDWLNRIFRYEARSAPSSIQAPPLPRNWIYPRMTYAVQREQIATYLAGLGACPATQVSGTPDLSSVEALQRSVEPLRQQMIADIVGEQGLPPERPIEVLERQVVERKSEYTIEWVRFKGRFSDIELGGWLATPNGIKEKRPGVLSFDSNYDPRWVFGITPEPFTYLNAYGDALAREGYVVFAPYMPSSLADGWGAALSAKTGDKGTVWTYLLPLYMSGIDYLLAQPNIDAEKLVAYGISYAGSAALMTTAVDKRISTLVFSNGMGTANVFYSDPSSIRSPIWSTEICAFVDQFVIAQIAPKWFVWESGAGDWSFNQEYQMEMVGNIVRVYDALGYGNRFRLIPHEEGHETDADRTLPVLRSILGPDE